MKVQGYLDTGGKMNFRIGHPWAASLQDYAWAASLLRNMSLRSKNQYLNIVTGADATHAKSLVNLLNSIKKFEPSAGVTIWDLGLSNEQVISISQLSQSFQIRKFDFDSHPKFMDIKVAAGHYAWKPLIIEETMQSKMGILMWLDAGNILTGRLRLLKRVTISKGLFSPYSSGTIAQWTHPETLLYMNLSSQHLSSNNCNGALVSVLLSNDDAVSIVRKWKELSLERDCIAPIGSNRSNHRQDQAVLTVLCELGGFNEKARYRDLNRRYNVLTHQDVD